MGETNHTHLNLKFKSKICLLFLIVICLMVMTLNYFWLSAQDQTLVGIDSWDFYPQTMHVYRHLTGQEEVGFDPGISHGSYRGPLFHWASLLPPLLAGPRHQAFALTNSLFFIFLLIIVFLIGRRLTGNGGGLAAVWLTAVTPIMLFGSRCYNLEIPMAALTAFSVLALLRSDGFTRPIWSLVFGITAAGAMLVKGVAFLYFLPPLLGLCAALVVGHFRAGSAKEKRLTFRQAGLFIATMALGLGVALWWYRDGFRQLYQVITGQIADYHRIYANPLQTEGGQSAFQQIFWEVGIMLLALGLPGFFSLLQRRPAGWEIICCWGLIPALGFLSGPADLSRFLTASWPAFALAGAWLLVRIHRRRPIIAAGLGGMVFIVGFLQIIVLQSASAAHSSQLLTTPGLFFAWTDREEVVEALDPLLHDNGEAVAAIYSRDAMGRIPPKTVYYFLAVAFPRVAYYAASGNTAMNYRFATMCEHLDQTTVFIEILPSPVPRSAGAPPPAPAAPGGDPQALAAYQECLEKIAVIRTEWPLAADIRPAPSRAQGSFSEPMKIYQRPGNP